MLADALIDDGPSGERARQEMSQDLHWVAPAHLVVEVLSVIRGRLLGRKLQPRRAEDAVATLAEIEIDQVDALPLARRIWELRDNVTAYDAAYLAVAEDLGCEFVTSDAGLTRVNGVRCPVRLLT